MPLLPSLRGLVRGTEKAKILPGNNGMYVCMYVNFISTRYIHQLLIHM